MCAHEIHAVPKLNAVIWAMEPTNVCAHLIVVVIHIKDVRAVN